MDETLQELKITAERVERFRAIHEDAVRDLRDRIAEARASGYDHDEIDQAMRRARESVRRFTRLPGAEQVLGSENGNGTSAALG